MRTWTDKDTTRRHCVTDLELLVGRAHPADRPTILRELAGDCKTMADKAEKTNEREGVPEKP